MNWKCHLPKFKEILDQNNDEDDEAGSVKRTKEELIPFLRAEPAFKRLGTRVISALEEATTFHTFNQALKAVYDFADDKRIWLGLRGTDSPRPLQRRKSGHKI